MDKAYFFLIYIIIYFIWFIFADFKNKIYIQKNDSSVVCWELLLW